MKPNLKESGKNKTHKSSDSILTKNKDQAKEIRLMTAKIISRYEIYDVNLARILAFELYKNGIGLDKFNLKYYNPPFDLDEIVNYVMSKILKGKKILKFPNLIEEKNLKINEEYFLVEEELDNISTTPDVQSTNHSNHKKITSLTNWAEIKKITNCLINRYEIIDEYFAYIVALELYNNGIGLDKFQPQYYMPPFHLDEIVSYVISKKLKDKKVIFNQEIEHDSQLIITNSKQKLLIRTHTLAKKDEPNRIIHRIGGE